MMIAQNFVCQANFVQQPCNFLFTQRYSMSWKAWKNVLEE